MLQNFQFHTFTDSGRAISFKPDDDSTFLVGTDEGMVYLCTTQYSSRYLNTYPVSSIFIRIGGKISTGRPTTRLCTTSSGTPSSQTSSSPVLQVIFLLCFSWRYFQWQWRSCWWSSSWWWWYWQWRWQWWQISIRRGLWSCLKFFLYFLQSGLLKSGTRTQQNRCSCSIWTLRYEMNR